MRRSRPLLEAHPEFRLIETLGLSREYRVESWHLSRGKHGHLVSGFPWVSWFDGFLVILSGLLWPSVKGNVVLMMSMGIGLSLVVYWKATQVLWESVLVLPLYGIQLETHRGFPFLPLLVSRKFIPLTEVQDVLINEGLRKWDVRYYLAILFCPQLGQHPPWQNVLPSFPVLIEVYHGVHECLHNGAEDVQDIINS
ncbi:hypothetical protein B0F90DRAFT_1808283 [Multifurca ochricompacta]|uniref:Phosphatidylinositol N-acetylglucosaminyltransferase subunit H conserved domain-containing protein n=1 Tax=Multifurca ochricompacta TaxID=376703 RepID=A0AAD4MAM9_9AGAM|nr:hypothetical protein B0F90DRAFT_1808283 [Multifurca ochricompacta]